MPRRKIVLATVTVRGPGINQKLEIDEEDTVLGAILKIDRTIAPTQIFLNGKPADSFDHFRTDDIITFKL